MSEGKAAVEEYVLVEVFTGEIVKRFDNPKKANTWGRMQSVYRLDFSDFKTEGTYVLKSEIFRYSCIMATHRLNSAN